MEVSTTILSPVSSLEVDLRFGPEPVWWALALSLLWIRTQTSYSEVQIFLILRPKKSHPEKRFLNSMCTSPDNHSWKGLEGPS